MDLGGWLSNSKPVSAYRKCPRFNEYMRTNFSDETLRASGQLQEAAGRGEIVQTRLTSALNRKPPSLIMKSREDERYRREGKENLELSKVYMKPDECRGNPGRLQCFS
jgi:hypothetical protein